MKPIDRLNNVERAKILHQLFPEEINPVLVYMSKHTEYILANADHLRKEWSHGLINFEMWLQFAGITKCCLAKYGHRLNKTAALFADQLFDGLLALYTVDCIAKYAETENAGPKFSKAVELFFNYN